MQFGAAFLRHAAVGFTLAASLCFLLPPAWAGVWTTGYYPAYRQAAMPASQVDFSALTHVIHFSIAPNSDGSIDTSINSMTPARSIDVVTKAHAAGRPVLISVAGSGSGGFIGATASPNRATFIANLLDFMDAYSYDGIDIDWEPLNTSEANQYTNFVKELRLALNAFEPRRLLTVATAQQPRWFAALQSEFDQINLMTYSLSGTWPGWVTWFNAPIYDGGYRFPSTGGLVPSADGMVDDFLEAGVAASKLGIGIAFYGKRWAGGSGTSTGGAALPRQSWTEAPTTSSLSYATIMSTYYDAMIYHWDSDAQAAYLSIDNPGSADDEFISYDDEHTCQAKVSYARNRALGGVMIWELGQGYRSTQPAGQREPLLQAIKQTVLATPDITAVWHNGQDIVLRFSSMPLAQYRVLWTTNLAGGEWNTLTNNLSGEGGTMQVTDTGAAASSSPRYYRVRTPP
ncbi:MAG TPA: glycoside hydrolase family 18 protein [Candidatus Paceibacterota bacterium]|nr:glycoside hydrolase family 18 protein [Verrucomicrobiota bacterium]HSA11527.1 glycoside hydrolase family 18 protein [Candidatus Paceibacterota bacterium]